MKKMLLMICLLFGELALANKVSPEEFLKMIDMGKIDFDVYPPITQEIAVGILLKINPGINPNDIGEKMLNDIQRSLESEWEGQYEYFDKKWLNVRYVDDVPYRYSVTFDFFQTRKCKLRIEKLDMSCGNPVCKENVEEPGENPNVDYEGVTIDDKYCEKIYGTKIEK